MTLFLDTANLNHIRRIFEWGICEGVTTNQQIFLKSGLDFTQERYEDTIKEICSVVNGPVSVELTKTAGSVNDLIEEAKNRNLLK